MGGYAAWELDHIARGLDRRLRKRSRNRDNSPQQRFYFRGFSGDGEAMDWPAAGTAEGVDFGAAGAGTAETSAMIFSVAALLVAQPRS